jgi:parallel beta-helix repeat protein
VSGNNVLLDHLHAHHNYLTNIHFWATHDCTVQNSVVHDANDYNDTDYSGGNADGISANGFSQRITIRNNESYHNSDDGIDTWDSSNNVIEGNYSHDNGWDKGDGSGYKTGYGGGNVYRNNRAVNNLRWGFDAGYSDGCEYYDNVATGNGNDPFVQFSGTSIQVGNSWS